MLIIGFANLLGHPSIAGRLVLLLPVFIFWMLLGVQLFYFRLTSDTLEIRNQFFPWICKRWPLEDIDNIVFEYIEGRGITNNLRIHTYDFRTEKYSAIGLRENVRLPDPAAAGMPTTADSQ